MRVAVVGSRTLEEDKLEDYLPEGVSEIISGGATGIDACAKAYAGRTGLKYTEYLPDYERYGRAAPIKRNDIIIENADFVLIIWDGKSRGTDYVRKRCEKIGKEYKVVIK